MREAEAQHSPEFHTFSADVADPGAAATIHRSFSRLFWLTVEPPSRGKAGESPENRLCHITRVTCK